MCQCWMYSKKADAPGCLTWRVNQGILTVKPALCAAISAKQPPIISDYLIKILRHFIFSNKSNTVTN